MKFLSTLILMTAAACSAVRDTVINAGVAGNSTSDLVNRVEKDVLSTHADIVIIMVGTNDMVNSKKLVTYADFSANYRKILQQVATTGAELLLMSPPPVDTASLFKRHDPNAFAELPNARLDSATSIISRLAAESGLHFIDINGIFERMNSPNADATSLIMNIKNSGRQDGVHPTREGYKRIAAEIYAVLKEKKLLKKNSRIICFGDSMTFGAFMEGAGTSDGDSYPAFLKRMLNGSHSLH